MNLSAIDWLILDVDGVLTDGTITMDADGELTKSFHVQDGFAIKLWHQSGGHTAILTSRKHPAVKRRAAELGIEEVRVGVSDKLDGYEEMISSKGCSADSICYVGDDYPDLKPLSRSGFGVAVSNAVPAIKRSAGYVTRRRGGCGAVAEIVELILRKKKMWSSALYGEI